LSDRHLIVKFRHRGGNVFLDLGFPARETKRLLATLTLKSMS
jgi:hypothetical protein